LTLQEAFSSAQYTFESDFPGDGFLHFYVGSRTIPKGYIWVFPKTGRTISVGAGLFGTHHALPKARHFLDAFVSSKFPGTAAGAPITGCVPLAVCPTLLARQNVVAVGDAARQCNPLTAGGIMNALEAADLAVKHLLACGRPPADLGPLARYSSNWARKPRREQKLFLVLQKAFLTLSDAEIARAIATASSVFAGRLDRSRPFSFPLLKSVRMFVAFLPRVARHLGVLFE
jgi:flavin-dependent dehydrogenase